jgi:hypothetical protein
MSLCVINVIYESQVEDRQSQYDVVPNWRCIGAVSACYPLPLSTYPVNISHMDPIVFEGLQTLQGANSNTFTRPPLDIDHDATIPSLFAHHAVHSPKHKLFVFDKEDGTVRTIDYAEAYRAIRNSAGILKRDYMRVVLNGKVKPKIADNTDELPVIGILAISGTLKLNYLSSSHNISKSNYISQTRQQCIHSW